MRTGYAGIQFERRHIVALTLKQIREVRGMNQQDVCALAHLSVKTLSRMENGYPVDKRTFLDVCDVLDVKPEQVLGVTIGRKGDNSSQPSRQAV